MKRALALHSLLFALVVMLVPGVASAIPQGITLSGHLTDAEGNPIQGGFAAQVRVYSSETKENLVGTFNTSVIVERGNFHGLVLLTGDILLMSEVWYTFAIDLDNNGLDEEDYFDGVYQITSVPFSLTGKPVTFFETHGGQSNRGFGSTGGGGGIIPMNTVWVVPFSSPPGGVQFNRMSCKVGGGSTQAKFMVGIYDERGELLYTSPITTPQLRGGPTLHSWEVEGALEPSKIHYGALWSDNWDLQLFMNISVPSVPTSGELYLGGNENGLLPTLAFDNINPDGEYYPISIGLYMVDEESPAKMKEHLGPGIDHKKKKEEASE